MLSVIPDNAIIRSVRICFIRCFTDNLWLRRYRLLLNNLEEWLLENGGPAIQLRMSALQNSSNVEKDTDHAVSALLDIDEVHSVLNYLDGFQTPNRDKKTLEHLIHYYKDTCIENFFPLIMDMGFHAGIPIFDEKMSSVKDLFRYLVALANESVHCYNYTIMLHRFFFMSGFSFPEVIASMEDRLDAIHKVAQEKLFDIYQDDRKLPKKPPVWADVGVLKDELNPFSLNVEKPLPTIYDIWSLAYYTDTCTDMEKAQKINDIVAYIFDPEFQKIREGYGLIWVESRRRYHACGWSPTLPFYEIEGHPAQSVPYPLLDCLDFMSHFKTVHQSKWFHDCLNHLEQYKTEKGTYIFPKAYLHKKYIDKAFLNEKNLSLKRNERELLKRELVSTMKMVEIYRRIM